MSKNYTQKTAALKATDADIRSLRIKHNGPNAVNGLSNILDVIPSVTDGNTGVDYHIPPVINFSGNLVKTVPSYTNEKLTSLDIQIEDHAINASDFTLPLNPAPYAVRNNVMLNAAGEKIGSIKTSSIKDGTNLFKDSGLAIFESGLDKIVIGTDMFKNTTVPAVDADMPNLYIGDGMFQGTSIATFNSDVRSLNSAVSMFEGTQSLRWVDSNLHDLRNGTRMFANSSIVTFTSDTNHLSDGTEMFANSNIEDVNCNLISLVDGTGMFENTNLSIHSVASIAESLPIINREVFNDNGILYFDLERGGCYYFDRLTWNDTINDFDRLTYYDIPEGGDTSDLRYTISPSTIGEIMITWKDPEIFEDEWKVIITNEYFQLMALKGWTVISNIVYNSDSEASTKIYARPFEVETTEEATHTDSSGKHIKLRTATNVVYPVKGFAKRHWKQYESLADAESKLGLTALSTN